MLKKFNSLPIKLNLDMTPKDIFLSYGTINFIYSIVFDSGLAIVHWADDQDCLREMIFPINSKALEEIMKKTISLRECYQSLECYVVDTYPNGNKIFYKPAKNEIEEYLPDAGITLP